MGSNPSRPTTNEPRTFDAAQSSGRIANYLLWLQREGYKPQSITSHGKILRYLARHCNLSDPETVREFLASHRSSGARKENIVGCYSLFSKHEGIAFSKPRYQRQDSVPFIPLQQECEAILETSKSIRHATLLRLLYETGCRIGEASQLQFKDFDFERMVVRVNSPEKGSRAREVRISEKLAAMVRQFYSKYPEEGFPNYGAARKHLGRVRRQLAKVSFNPRFLQIHLHTFRHFRATYLYHSTKDLLYV